MFRRMADAVGKEAEIETFDSFLFHIDAMGRLSVKGCRKLLVCEENKIEMDCGSKNISLEGTDMRVDIFSESLTEISGKISGIHIKQWEAGKC